MNAIGPSVAPSSAAADRTRAIAGTRRRGLSSASASVPDPGGVDGAPSPSPAYAEEGDAGTGEWAGCTRRFLPPIRISARAKEVLHNPLYNKGTAFKSGERDRMRLRGLLPPRVTNLGLQKDRVLKALRAEESDIKRNIMLEDVHDRNETLYHRIIIDHMEEMAPL